MQGKKLGSAVRSGVRSYGESLSQSWEKQLRRRKALGECKQYTVPRTLCTRNIFSRVARDFFVQRTLCNVKQKVCPSQEWFVIRAHHVSFALVIAGFSTFSHPQLLTSPLLPSRGDEHPPDLRTAGFFGHLAMQSPLTVYEPNAIVEISSTEVTLIHRRSRRIRFCSVYNSNADVTSLPVSSEVDERQSIGRLSSSLRMQ